MVMLLFKDVNCVICLMGMLVFSRLIELFI